MSLRNNCRAFRAVTVRPRERSRSHKKDYGGIKKTQRRESTWRGKSFSRLFVRTDGLGGQISYVLEENSQGIKVFDGYQHNRRSDVSHNFLQHFCPLSELRLFCVATFQCAIIQTDSEGAFIAVLDKNSQKHRES